MILLQTSIHTKIDTYVCLCVSVWCYTIVFSLYLLPIIVIILLEFKVKLKIFIKLEFNKYF